MKKAFPLVTIILFFLFSLDSSAQEKLKIEFFTLDSTSVLNGQVDVDVRVREFSNLIASQFTITWNPEVLEVIEIPFISEDLPGLNIASFALPSQTLTGERGRLAHTWLSADALPKSLPDNHVLFTMRFKAIGDSCSTTDFDLLRTQNYQTEISNNELVNIGATFNELPILITGNNCNGFTTVLACDANPEISLSPWESETIIQAEDILEGGPYDYSVISMDPVSINCNNIGETIIVTATHLPTGNNCFSEAVIRDGSGPVIILDDEYTLTLDDGNAQQLYQADLVVAELNDGTYDNCSAGSEISFVPATIPFDCTMLGQQTIELMAVDGLGNTSTIITTINVELGKDVPITCPPNRAVDCGTDINDSSVIENILGAAFSSSGCIPVYEDFEGYDQNQDGDMEDEYLLNGVMISEEYVRACEYGTIRRVWQMPGSNSTCIQSIGLNNVGSSFDGDTMIDWPYSLDEIVSVEDNDGGLCSDACSSVVRDSITIQYDLDGKAIGADIIIDCEDALCEEPYWQSSSCSLIGWASETETTDLANGSRSIKKTYYVIDACQFDTLTLDGRWSWTVNALIRTVDNDDVVLSMPDVTAGRGETVCMPVTVQNFTNIQSAQGSVNWNAEVAQFNEIKDFGLQGLTEGSFGLNALSMGKISFAWFDNTTINPATLNDGDTLFNLCLLAIGPENSSSLVSVSNDPTVIEIGSENTVLSYSLEQGSLFVGQANCDPDTLKPVPYCLNDLEVTLENDSIELWAIDFNAGSFDNCTSSDMLRYTFSDTPPESDPEFSGRSSRQILTGADIPSDGMSQMDVYIWDESGNSDFCSVSVRFNNEETGNETVEFIFGDYYGAKDSQICVPLHVNNFTDVEAFQGTVSWDASVLSYTEAQNYTLSGFTDANINSGSSGDGILPFVWFDLTAQNPATLSNGSAVFELCFELAGEEGEVSPIDLISAPALIQVSSASSGIRPFTVDNGSVTILDGNCGFDLSDINWPQQEVTVYVEGINDQNALNLLTPETLLTLEGVDSTIVYPIISLPAFCSNVVGLSFSDQLFIESNLQFRLVRDWTILDWLTANVYTFQQTILTVEGDGFICDVLPNSAPVGDCDTGHSLEDDVEWPDDLSIADHRIDPDELNLLVGIDIEDTQPIFFNSPDLYEAQYADLVVEMIQDTIIVEREWTVTRQNIVGLSWTYIQKIEVDISVLDKLVSINTFGLRPLPGVMINTASTSNSEGLAFTDGTVNPVKTDDSVNGLNIRDMVLIRAYVLGMIQFDSFELLAADLGDNGVVSTLDLVLLERIVLEIDTLSSREWRFVDETTTGLNELQAKAHFVAYKPGDVDDSAFIGTANSPFPSASLKMQDIFLNAGESYSIPIVVNGEIDAVATEMHLSFDHSKINITDVYADQNLDQVSYNVINDNQLSIISSNTNLETQILDSLSSVVIIEIEALENGTLGGVFGLIQNRPSLLLDSNYDLIMIEALIEAEISTSTKELDNAFRFNLYPNPAKSIVYIQAPVQADISHYTLELFDINGQQLISENNADRLHVGHLPNGTYAYKLITSLGVQTGLLMLAR